MTIDYTVTIDYGDSGPGEDEASPEADDLATWIIQGMARDGLTSPEGVEAVRQ